MRRRFVLALLAAVVVLSAVGAALLPGEGRAAKDELVIGITQFPSTLHPNIDPWRPRATCSAWRSGRSPPTTRSGS